MLHIDSTWLHTIRPGQWKNCIRECFGRQLVRNSVDACPLSALDQNSKEAADTAQQPNAWCARVKWIILNLVLGFKDQLPYFHTPVFLKHSFELVLVPQKEDIHF